MQDNKKLDELFEAALRSDDDSIEFERLGSKANAIKTAAEGGAVQVRADAAEAAKPSPFQKAANPEVRQMPKPEVLEAQSEAPPAFTEKVEPAQGATGFAIDDDLGALLDAKHAKERSSRRRGNLLLIVFLLAGIGSASWWVISNPERVEQIKGLASEVKSATDANEVAAKYDEALEKVAERGDQINEATAELGVEPETTDEE